MNQHIRTMVVSLLNGVDSTYVDAIMRQMRHEVVLVANTKGIPLKEKFKARKWLPSQRYSTLQDLDAHRHTE